MACISLQKGIIYGPVLSRRLGRSLGINLLPTTHKVCSYNCLYCQYGPTIRQSSQPDPEYLPNVEAVLMAVERALKKPRSLDCLTFSGNGEPTIHPDFPIIVQGVKELKERLRPDAKLAILSNSSLVMNPRVTSALSLFDIPMMKLDAGDEETFQAINRPVKGIYLSDILAGLKDLPNIVIQSALIDGVPSNICGVAFQSWVEALKAVNPTAVHIYSTDRPTAEDSVECVSPTKLSQIKDHLVNEHGMNVSAFWAEAF
jgi:wyosine [tRNA(Phe)-imidazoG37] synthetase (radical SAM superfamily)